MFLSLDSVLFGRSGEGRLHSHKLHWGGKKKVTVGVQCCFWQVLASNEMSPIETDEDGYVNLGSAAAETQRLVFLLLLFEKLLQKVALQKTQLREGAEG